jgi:hypothetical protein
MYIWRNRKAQLVVEGNNCISNKKRGETFWEIRNGNNHGWERGMKADNGKVCISRLSRIGCVGKRKRSVWILDFMGESHILHTKRKRERMRDY